MRSAEQIGRTVEQWQDYQREQRRRTLRDLLVSLAQVRQRREHWYVWVTEGQPILTAEQYAELGRKRATRRQSA